MRQRAFTRRDKGKRRFFWIALIVLSVVTLSCQFLGFGEAEPTATEPLAEDTIPTEEPAEDLSARLLGKEWVLIAYGDAQNPVVVEPGTHVTAVFNEDGSMTGSGGCNTYSTSYETDGENISFGPAAVTAMACEFGMEQESAYFAALESASTYEFTDPGEPVTDRLLINYDSGKGYAEQLVYDAATTLTDTTWILTSYGDPNDPTPTQSGVVTTAIFSADGTLNGSGGCNEYSAEYNVDGNLIDIGTPTSTRMACERGMEQEQAYLAALELAESYNVGNGLLEITYADGAAVLRFSALDMPLENVRWVLSSIDGQPLPTGVQATALFTPGINGEENQVTGSAGCNSYFGPYTVEGNNLSAGPFGATQMMCPDEVMQVEQAFLSGLENSQSFRIILKQLIIETSNGSLTFYADRFPLEGPVWTLTLMGDKDNPRAPIESANFTASFGRQFGMPSGLVLGTTGCNDYNVVYYSNLEEIKANIPGLLPNNCSEALQEEEQAYFLGLNSAREYRILGNELQMFYDNQVLHFVGAFPPAAGEAGPLAVLDGTQWTLFSMDSLTIIPGSVVTAAFTINEDGLTGQMSGSGGCNPYNADITGVFTIGSINSTQALCDTPAGVMEQENRYFAALQTAFSFSLEGGALTINTEAGVLVFNTPSPVQTLSPTETPGAVTPLPPTDTPGAVTPLPPTETPTIEIPMLTVTVDLELPEAVINAPNQGQAGQAISFDGSASTPSGNIVSYAWNFGDGSPPQNGATVQHTFSTPGVYIVTLVVTANNGLTGIDTLMVTIS